ncbi:MAG TPA: outer membrane protein transport protein [Polyangia bacterium]|nr:outer membrane protein transport protein [Polyangia bacterium]
MRQIAAAAFALALAAASATGARANPVDAFGFGSRAVAMGGAATAASEDASANYYNPAGLVVGRELRIDLGYRYAQPLLRINRRDLGVDASRGFNVGLVAPAAIGPFRFAFGVALWLPDQRLTRVRSLPFAQPRFVYYDNRIQRLFLAANLAIQIVPKLYIGAGLVFMSRTQGTLSLQGNVAVSNPDDSSLVTSINVDLVAVRYWQAGIRWDALPYLSLGASFRQDFTLALDQQFAINGSIGNPGIQPVVPAGFFQARSISTDLFQPWQLTFGAAVRPTRHALVTFDLTYARWSEFPVAAANLTLTLDIGQFNPQVHLPPPRSYPAPGFRDIVIPRVGVEWRVLDRERVGVDARGGYSYEPSPVPDQFGESNLADSDKHTFACGVGVELKRLAPILRYPLNLDAHVAVTYLPDRVSRKVDPRDPVGDFVADGVVVQLGLMLRSKF